MDHNKLSFKQGGFVAPDFSSFGMVPLSKPNNYSSHNGPDYNEAPDNRVSPDIPYLPIDSRASADFSKNCPYIIEESILWGAHKKRPYNMQSRF